MRIRPTNTGPQRFSIGPNGARPASPQGNGGMSTRKKVVAGAVAGIIIAASGTAAILKSEDII